MLSSKTLDQTKQAHRATLIKTLEHRIEVAKAQGKTNLVAQLEAERNYYLK